MFTIQGPYPVLRHALRKRGWVEKFANFPAGAENREVKKKSSTATQDVDDDDDDGNLLEKITNMVGALYSVVRPIPWYCGNPVFSREIININTSKRAFLFTNINIHKQNVEKAHIYPFGLFY